MFGHEHHQLVVTLLDSAGHAMPELGNSHLSGLLEGPGVADLALHVHALDLHAFFQDAGLDLQDERRWRTPDEYLLSVWTEPPTHAREEHGNEIKTNSHHVKGDLACTECGVDMGRTQLPVLVWRKSRSQQRPQETLLPGLRLLHRLSCAGLCRDCDDIQGLGFAKLLKSRNSFLEVRRKHSNV